MRKKKKIVLGNEKWIGYYDIVLEYCGTWPVTKSIHFSGSDHLNYSLEKPW